MGHFCVNFDLEIVNKKCIIYGFGFSSCALLQFANFLQSFYPPFPCRNRVIVAIGFKMVDPDMTSDVGSLFSSIIWCSIHIFVKIVFYVPDIWSRS